MNSEKARMRAFAEIAVGLIAAFVAGCLHIPDKRQPPAYQCGPIRRLKPAMNKHLQPRFSAAVMLPFTVKSRALS